MTSPTNTTSQPEVDSSPPDAEPDAEPEDTEQPARVADVLSARDRKLAALHTSNEALEAKLAALQAEHLAALTKLQNPTPAGADQTVQHHIKLLHDYNETRDVGLGLMGVSPPPPPSLPLARAGGRTALTDEFGLKPSD
ncbi:hypothetical protein EDC01DRAFT_783909 [Geopyxis carbonaria]|nr:hypothetical protein EDC01DRAFT_783909 [Geopyxis carbonaria]